MMQATLRRALLAAALWVAPQFAVAQIPVPPLAARVTDLTGTLTAEQRAVLDARLASLESRKGSQVAVLMVPSVQPEAVEQYAIRVFDQWQLGRKGVDDGVLLVIAKNDRKLRIEVGRGLEGAIPDAIAKRIIDEDIVPRFKPGDFYGGITAGVDRVIRLIDGEQMPAPKPSSATRSGWDNETLVYALLVIFLTMGFLKKLLGRFLGSGVAGVAFGGILYMLSASLMLAAFIGFIIFLINLFGATVWSPSGGGRSSGGGNWASSGGSWSSSSSSWDGGGFSGGGGSSGGGGASGSW